MFFEKRVPRPVITLNVVPLIDICSLIIIFLILGTVFGESSVGIPKSVDVPTSISKESVENAPSVAIEESKVTTTFEIPPVELKDLLNEKSEARKVYVKALKDFVAKVPAKDRQSGLLLNVIADRRTPYQVIFDVISVFREAGFQSMLFVARGK